MPYRIEKGSDVLLIMKSGGPGQWPPQQLTTNFDRTVDFHKKELIASPLEEHNKDGIPESEYPAYPWGFSVTDKWSKGEKASEVEAVYADEVRSIRVGTSKKVKTVVVKGSKNNQYTVELSDAGDPTSCTCPAHRFRQKTCKHMRGLIPSVWIQP
jgi:hypothetical protein